MELYNKKYCLKMVVISIGLLLAWVIASLQSGFAENVESLGGSSYIYNASLDKFKIKTNCEISEKTVNILDDEAEMGITLINADKYKYIIFDINQLQTTKNANIKVCFINDLNINYHSKDIKLDGEKQIVEIPAEKFSLIKISFTNMKNESVLFNKIEFRSSLENENGKEFLYIFLPVFLIFICIVILFWRLLGEKCVYSTIYAPINIIKCIFNKVYYGILEIKSFNIKNIRYWLTTTLFLVLMYKMFSLPSFSDPYYRQIVILTCIMVLMIAIIIADKKEYEYVKWNNPLAYAWFSLAILEIISEIIVGREYYFVGCARFFIFGFMFYVWGKNTDKLKLLRSFSLAVKISFIICFMWCLFVPYTKGIIIRYAGPFYSCNLFALYLVLPFSALIADIDEEFENKKLSFKFILKSMLLGGCITLVWLTQSRAALLAVLLISIICFGKWIVIPAFLKSNKKVILKLILIIIIIPSMYHLTISLMNQFALKNPETKIITEITRKAELFTIYAEASNKSRVLIKFTSAKNLNDFSSGRIGIWLEYLRNIGILGKNKYIFFESYEKQLAVHNGIIATMYITGIFAVIPYVIMLFYSFKYACIYFKRNAFKQRYGIFPLTVVIAFFCCAMLDIGDEDPFYKSIWLAYYLIVGFLMNMNNHPYDDKNGNDKEYELVCKKCDNILKHFKHRNVISIVIVVIMIIFIRNFFKNNNIYNNLVLNKKVVETPFNIVGTKNYGILENTNSEMPNSIKGTALYSVVHNGLTYFYYKNLKDELTVAVSENKIDWYKYDKVILECGSTGAFDDTLISKVNVVYVSPYYYMLYIGEDASGNTAVGLALSYDGINWTKKNIKGSIKINNVQNIYTSYIAKENILKLSYLDSSNRIGTVNISVTQNRDMCGFDAEADWTTSLVSSKDVLSGSYDIEGKNGNKSAWMQSEASMDIYYKEEASKLVISGYMPLDIYEQENINEIKMNIRINEEEVYKKVFRESQVFNLEIPLNVVEKQGEYMHVELITDIDFNLKKLGISEDERDLSYVLYSIKQE